MNLTGKNIRHLNTITHDGKVLVFGTAIDGTIYYSIKRSGFEDTAVQEGLDPFGFEQWERLRLGESEPDESVTTLEQETLADASGNLLLQSVFGSGPNVTVSADAPVQLVSALDCLYVFRQASNGKVLVSRFVLDGMTNELLPKLEVRFRRSKQRFEPQKTAASKNGDNFDNLDYRDIDGKSFFEPSLELSFAGNVSNGWFVPLFVPTAESDRNRWHLFVYDATAGKIILYTTGADDKGNFDLKDYLLACPDPSAPENTIYSSIPGIIRRTIDLQGLTVAGCPSATTYDIQKEIMTDAGPQLMRDVSRVMLAVPVTASGSTLVKTAIVDFALASDGTLSRIDATPDTSVVQRSDVHEVITPVSLFDDIKEIASTSPPPAGTVVATERGEEDQLQVRSSVAFPADLTVGSKVKIRGTRSYDGHYKVLSVDGKTFKVAASFQNNEAGFWEVVPTKQTGLVFDDMIVGAEKTLDGKLMITCPAHDLNAGDEVQISGTREYNGIFPITSVDALAKSFVLDTAYFTGEAANLRKVVRRGLRMGGADRVETPDLELVPPTPERDLGRTLSAWVRVDAAGNVEQSLIKDDGQLMNLAIGSDNKVKLVIRMSDGSTRTVTEPDAGPIGTWTHYSGSVNYVTAQGGDTRISLCRNGVEVAAQTVKHQLPCHLDDLLMTLDGGCYIEVANTSNMFARDFTVAFWAKVAGGSSGHRAPIVCRGSGLTGFSIYANPDNKWEFIVGDGSAWKVLTGPAVVEGEWVHLACTVRGTTVSMYVNGVLQGPIQSNYAAPNKPMRIGAGATEGGANYFFKGQIAGVEAWNRARSPAEIAEGLAKRMTGREPGLVGYWPLDDGMPKDLSPAKRHGEVKGNAAWKKAAYLHPQIVPSATFGTKLARVMSFDGEDDFIEVPAFASPTNAITVSIWARSATPTWNAFGCIISKRSSFMTHPWKGEKRITMSFWISGSSPGVISAPSVTFTPTDIQGWHLYTGTFDGSTVRFYVDGLLVGQEAASGSVAPDASGALYIGHDDGYGPTERNFNGQLADAQIWNVARSQADIQADMNRRFNGNEPGLVGYWPLDAGPADRSPSKLGGSFKGNPSLTTVGSAYVIGQAFRGEIAEVQIWSEARSADMVKATMHLRMTGQEEGLRANYRLGAIVFEKAGAMVPDFSRYGRNGKVYGEPFAGARRLERATGSDMKVVKYRSDELCAVSQRGVYEESFEFKVNCSDPAFDPRNADGTGQKLFAFSYWGKSSRGSKEEVAFSPGCVQESDFVSLGGGWYKATCRVVVPNGISLIRAFEISDVRGKWGAGIRPANEWTSIEIRKHHIRMISDTVTLDSYTDVTRLVTLPAQAQATIDKLADLRRAEFKVARIDMACADLLERIEVAKNIQVYIRERDGLVLRIPILSSQRDDLGKQITALYNNPTSYWQKIRARHSKQVADARDGRIYQYNSGAAGDSQLFGLRFLGEGWYNIYNKATGRFVTASTAATEFVDIELDVDANTLPEPTRSELARLQRWGIENLGDGYWVIKNAHTGTVWDVFYARQDQGTKVVHYRANGGANQHWALDMTKDLTSSANVVLWTMQNALASVDDKIAAVKRRLDWLNNTLADNETVDVLKSKLTTAQSSLDVARADLAAKDPAFMSALGRVSAVAMKTIATDDRNLETTGALLDFAQPAGQVRLCESCEGNVLLTYFDTQGRMRATAYDAAADSRNTAFEQWVPDAVRACVDIRDIAGIKLSQPITLPANGATCEAWVQYPLPARTSGKPYGLNVVACAEGNKLDAPLVVRNGKRLGILVDGWFFDSGVDLERKLGAGWHHLATSTTRSMTSFYADGVKLGSRRTVQPVLRLNGTSDFVEVPAHASPTAAVTVSIWARSPTSAWNASGCLVSKANAFSLESVAGRTSVKFAVVIGATSYSVEAFSLITALQDWHLYTGTFDGNYIRVYIDGHLVVTAPVSGTIQSNSGVMHIGHNVSHAESQDLLNAEIAEVSYWNTARSDNDIQDEFYQLLKGDEQGLIGYWRMEKVDVGGTTKIKDLTSTTGDAIVKGAPTDATITTLRDRSILVLGNTQTKASPIGRLAEVRLWNLGLSDAEIAANARTAISGCEPGLIGYWPLDEGAELTAYDRSFGGQAHGSMDKAISYVGCTANIGNPGGKVLSLPDRGDARIECPPVALASKSFTFECWARRSGAGMNTVELIATMGAGGAANNLFAFGFCDTGQLTLGFSGNDVVSTSSHTDTDWHHFCGTYDQATKKQRLYCDGALVGERQSTADLVASGPLMIGKSTVGNISFRGEIAEVRIWDKARSDTEIRSTMRRRLSGREANLIAHYPLDASSDNKVKDKCADLFHGLLKGTAELLLTTSLPIAGADSLVTSEYSSVEISGEGRKQAVMRRFYAHAAGGAVELLPEKRVEELTLQWVGNTQINPTLLGYIEGAPPIPSENLTVAEEYDGATTVTLSQSEETTYSWQRSDTNSDRFNAEGFLGVAWHMEGGNPFIQYGITEGKAGAVFNAEYAKTGSDNSSVSASSSLTSIDSLTLTGMFEDKESCPALGKRWVPKNVGYALVISGMADVFITKLKRSGRMVSYDIRPVEGVPLDVNTITFMINPAYVMNGSLDGMVGSMPADPMFYPHVPEMRAQYGSLYPASYYRLQDAYNLKAEIERQDKERQTFFEHFDAEQIDNNDSADSEVTMPSVSTTNTTVSSKGTENDLDTVTQNSESQKIAQKNDATQRKAKIDARNKSLEERVRATDAFAHWQERLQKFKVKAGKRNIVNTYVWDGDGGLRVEEESFAHTIEHSIGTEQSYGGGAGGSMEFAAKGFKVDLSLVGSNLKVNTNSKTRGQNKTLELNVDLSGVEKNGITDLQDKPVLPGEKVDRYRFMTFYLEGSTDHFADFFSYVVDPEWLMSNDEEARALRQARSAKPNKCWRVLHRVTYVERPVLMGVGKDLRVLHSQKEDETMRGFKAVEARIDALGIKLDMQLAAINAKLKP